MTDLVTVASQISMPIKIAWLLWLMWVVVQTRTFRWVRQPAALQPAAAIPQQTVVEPRLQPVARRRRRRRPRTQEALV